MPPPRNNTATGWHGSANRTRANGVRISRCAFAGLLASVMALLGPLACRPHDERPVLYTSVDETFARQIVAEFERREGLKVDVLFDSEAGKTTGLAKRLREEAGDPRADVFWSGEIFNTILLAREGLLAEYDSPAAADIPARYRDPRRRWTAVGVRARVLAFDPARSPADQLPRTWEELADPRWASRLSLANPLFGTTHGHIAAMFALWGEQRVRAFLTGLRDGGARLAAGNSSAVRDVIDRRAEVCATDTDDVWVAQRQGASLDLRYLDLGDGGTLLIPTSAGIVKGCRRPDIAQRLVDFLVSAECERLLARSDSRNIPVRPALRAELKLELPPETKLTFDQIADQMAPAAAAVREILIR